MRYFNTTMLLFLVGLLTLVQIPGAVRAEPLALQTEAIPLDPRNPERQIVGQLRYRAGFVLRSPHRRFGGLSGLLVSADGRTLVAVSDNGYRFDATLHHDAKGTLVGLDEAEITPLIDPAGKPLEGKRATDAESLALHPEGGLVVAFEHKHRLWHYPGGKTPPSRMHPPLQLPLAPRNDGIEALTLLNDGRLLAITEGFATRGGVLGWVGRSGDWSLITLETGGLFSPTAAATLPNGDVVVLERHYSLFEGASARLSWIGATAFRPNARIRGRLLALLRPPLNVDNMEGLAVRKGPGNETLLYWLSDDNYRRGDQRTLLLQFEVMDQKP